MRHGKTCVNIYGSTRVIKETSDKSNLDLDLLWFLLSQISCVNCSFSVLYILEVVSKHLQMKNSENPPIAATSHRSVSRYSVLSKALHKVKRFNAGVEISWDTKRHKVSEAQQCRIHRPVPVVGEIPFRWLNKNSYYKWLKKSKFSSTSVTPWQHFVSKDNN